MRDERSRSSGAGWLIAGLVAVALVVGIYFFSQTTTSEAVRDNAIANAANEVGAAAGSVGDAAQQVGRTAQETTENVTN